MGGAPDDEYSKPPAEETLRADDPAAVELAVRQGDPLSGANGFAGLVDLGSPGSDGDRALVRDVLGREPLYIEADAPTDGIPADDAWAFDPTALDDPVLFPAGAIQDEAGRRDRLRLPTNSGVGDVGGSAAAVPGSAVDELRDAIDAALGALDDATPVAFSGGVDSGLVATGTDGPLFVAGFPESHDLEAARDAAAAMDRELREVRLTHDAIERAVHAVAEATGRTNPMDVSIAIPLYLVAERVAADGHETLAVGQGADELFGGYAKVAKAPEDDRVEADSVAGARDELLGTLPEQLPRDVLAIRAAGVEPIAPLLDDRVVRAALALPEALLVRDEERKVALRRVATDRLPESVAIRDKKALQYGSLVSRELDRLARQHGFKRRMDDHVGQYVRDLVEE
ncbi:asparagine synthase [Salinarchaeum sp. Harcht-Bsk1]|uniref:asparagine synthase C-terminal domain-containing protein n=1 Tax=Salinarchaeum sp. Harcht-Bsk1 TaxID=1333523 RepID=UPI0003422CD3|nr:asparagine synthase-related protein [Salinarchaeum sp. Harcht-Bsk1]AGN02252.1 asparagine synthase [Salinarchaeum sp. Harcht-Bsk1]